MPTKRQRSNASFKSTRTNRFWSWAAACALRSRPPWRVERRRHALPCPSFRQGNQLAEGQKSAEVKHDFTIPPPSANQNSWRRGSNFPRDTQIFRPSRHHLAEGVEFPEKNAGPWLLRHHSGEGSAPPSAVNLTCGVRFWCCRDLGI